MAMIHSRRVDNLVFIKEVPRGMFSLAYMLLRVLGEEDYEKRFNDVVVFCNFAT